MVIMHNINKNKWIVVPMFVSAKRKKPDAAAKWIDLMLLKQKKKDRKHGK